MAVTCAHRERQSSIVKPHCFFSSCMLPCVLDMSHAWTHAALNAAEAHAQQVGTGGAGASQACFNSDA